MTAAFKELNTGVSAALAGTTPETIDVAADDQKWKDSRADSPLQWSPNEAGVFAWNPKDNTFDALIALFLAAGVPAETEIGLGFDEIDISPLPRQDGQGNSMAGATLRGMVDPSIGAIDNTRSDALLLRSNSNLDRFPGENVDSFWAPVVAGTPTADSDIYPSFLIQLPEAAQPKVDQYRLRVQCSLYSWVPIVTDLTAATTNTAFLYTDIAGVPTIQSRIVGTAPATNSIELLASYYREFVIQVVQSTDMKNDVDVQRGKYAPQNFFTWSPCLTADKNDCIPTDAQLTAGTHTVVDGSTVKATWDDYTELINILSTPVDSDQIILDLATASADFVTLDTSVYSTWEEYWDTKPDSEWLDTIKRVEVVPCQMLTFNVTSAENFERNWNVYQSFGFHDAAFRDAQPVFTQGNLDDADNQAAGIQQMWSGMASFRVPCDSIRGEEMPYNEYVRKFQPEDFGVSRLWVRAEWNHFADVWTREAKFDFKI